MERRPLSGAFALNVAGRQPPAPAAEAAAAPQRPSALQASYGFTQPANDVLRLSILIMATGLSGLRSGPMVITPDTPW